MVVVVLREGSGVGRVLFWENWVMKPPLECGVSGVQCGLNLGSSHMAEVNLLDSWTSCLHY